ncbi:MAG: putative major facilitator superfamily transporter, partial [Acidimicrobiales bacterium]|nr:putative major facilitator superfamily transporter [Acidimicrobiales bacterium]
MRPDQERGARDQVRIPRPASSSRSASPPVAPTPARRENRATTRRPDDAPPRRGIGAAAAGIRNRGGFRPGRISPFTRLARVQAVSAAADGCLALALALTVFIGLSPTQARPRVLLFLLITFVPFLVVAPLIGPVIDRVAGGRRLLMQVIALARALTLLLMAAQIDHVFVLYPLAFVALVLQKTQGISKSALVPSVVRTEADLVEANSKLGLISGVFGFAGAAVAGLAKLIFGVEGALCAGAILFVVAFVFATKLPSEVVAAKKASLEEKVELKSAGITLAASAMALLRASVGFCFFLLAFWLKTKEAGTLLVSASIGMVTVGVMIGNAIAPFLRRSAHEERILIGALGLTAVSGIAAAVFGGVASGVLLALSVNFCGALGRLAFDSIVQRDAPDANQGRAFAQFETKFQLAWVVGGIIPVIYGPTGDNDGPIGFAIVGGIAVFATVSYLVGTKRVQAGKPIPEPFGKKVRRQLAAEIAERRKNRRDGYTPTDGTTRPVSRPLPPPRLADRASDPTLPDDPVSRALRGDPLRRSRK